MGGKKSAFYHDDIWNLKYLPKFKWMHLTQQLAYERQERAQKLQVEVRQAKAEIEAYRKNVDRSKMISAMEAKKKARMEKNVQADHGVDPSKPSKDIKDGDSELDAIRRRFRQRKAIVEDVSIKHAKAGSRVDKVLKKVRYDGAPMLFDSSWQIF